MAPSISGNQSAVHHGSGDNKVEEPTKVAIVSGYFNPTHIGHLRLIQGAKKISPYVVTIVNNDQQQLLKKGRIIMPETDRLEIVSELRSVDHAVLAIDQDATVVESL